MVGECTKDDTEWMGRFFLTNIRAEASDELCHVFRTLSHRERAACYALSLRSTSSRGLRRCGPREHNDEY